MDDGSHRLADETTDETMLVAESENLLVFCGEIPKKRGIKNQRMVAVVADVFGLQRHSGIMVIIEDGLARLESRSVFGKIIVNF